MNGFIAKTLPGALLVGGLAACGCTRTGNYVDPCYPERYTYTSRREVNAGFAPQVQNGHILDQTLWNYHFEPGKPELNASGRDHIDGLVRRRPSPDPRMFLATSRDLPYDAANSQRFIDEQRKLDAARAQAVNDYITAQTSGRPMQFEVVIHDPSEVGQHADPMNRAIRLNQQTTTGGLFGGAGASTASSTGNSQGGASGGSAGGGAGGGGSGGSGGGGSGGSSR